jgi:hypothetical protein
LNTKTAFTNLNPNIIIIAVLLEFVNYSEKGKILIMGDLNARTGQESDFIENGENDSNIPLFDN